MHWPPTIQNRPHMAVDPETEYRDDVPLLSEEQDLEKMVQVFMVVCCYSCQTFQVQQVKKTNKWCCKVCNEKQSVIKVYGKGLAADCRKHVQKLNLMRADIEQNEIAQLQNNHPPEDYASTFTTEDTRPLPEDLELPDHPVLLAGKSAGKSKWTTFTEPQEEEEDADGPGETCTTDREVFNMAQKPRKYIKRSESDRGPRPQLSAPRPNSAGQGTSNSQGSAEVVYPYSSVSQEMESHLDDHTARVSSSNYTLPSDRYRKLDEDTSSFQSTSLQDLTSASVLSVSNHKDNIAKIKEDISRYSCATDLSNGVSSTEIQQSTEGEQVIPKVSSKWSQFMCEEDSEDEESYFKSLASGQVLSSGSTVARFVAPNELKGPTEK